MAKPSGIVVLQVFGWVYAILNAIAGIALFVERDNASLQSGTGRSDNELLWFGILYVAIAVVAVVATIALGRGNELARWLFAGVAVAQLVTIAWKFFAPEGHLHWEALISAALPITTLILLFGTSTVRDYFDEQNLASAPRS